MAIDCSVSGFPSAHRNDRQHIEAGIDLQRLFHAIDSDPAIVGAGVVYIDSEFHVTVLRQFLPICSLSSKKVILREAPKRVAPQYSLSEKASTTASQ